MNYAICAQTGSGKTLIYILSLMQNIIDLKEKNKNDKDISRPIAIILVPNKELTAQVYVQFNKMLKFCKDIKV